MTDFADHFSRVAQSYAAFRPRYPSALFAWIASAAPARQRALDCGTGNGQAAVALAEHFPHVLAGDPSVAQLVRAERRDGVDYVVMTAERAALPSRSVDVVTAAQALHWFDREPFFREATRVLRPNGLLVAWSYSLASITPEVDSILTAFHRDVVGPYWPPGRELVDAGYAGIELPLSRVTSPPFEMSVDWDLAQLLGYVATWSAVDRYRTHRGTDPIPQLRAELEPRWGALALRRTVRWPITILAGRKDVRV